MINFYNIDNIEFMKTKPDNYYNLAIVDPPYGLADAVVNSGGRFKRYHNENGNWDKNTPTKEYFNELFRVSENQIIWGGNYFDLPPNKCFIVWDKKQPQGISFAMGEYAWASFDKVAQIYNERTQGQIERFHPTQKPIDLYRWLLQNYAEEGHKILDTHGGSGSIAVACDMEKYSLDICEIDKGYFEASKKRFDKHKSQLTMF